ncbi:hypothetical protein [Cellulomonas sp. URHB0016]
MTETRTIRAMVVVDVVLVLTFVVMLVAFATSGTSDHRDGDAAVVSAPSGTPTGSGSQGTVGPAAFRLPSGNIACVVSEQGVTCTIASYTYAPPVVEGCTAPTGHVLVLDADGVVFQCETGPAPEAAGDDVPTLEYGSSSSAGDYSCTSATDGVTCTNGQGRGFRLARAAWAEVP